jgi:hypothetical protein
MLANAIADAKTNFFMQCSWEIQKWKSRIAHSPAKGQSSWMENECRGNGSTIPRLPVLRRRIIESQIAADKQSVHYREGGAARW